MNVKLIKKLVKKDDKTFTNFYLKLDNGNYIPIAEKKFVIKAKDKTQKDVVVSSYERLNLIAELEQ